MSTRPGIPQPSKRRAIPPGQSLGEYALILIVIIFAAVLGISQIGVQVNGMFIDFTQQGFPPLP